MWPWVPALCLGEHTEYPGRSHLPGAVVGEAKRQLVHGLAAADTAGRQTRPGTPGLRIP